MSAPGIGDRALHAVIVLFGVHPGHLEGFRAAVLANAADSLAREPGCHVFDVCERPGGEFVLYELYDDEEAFAAHLATDHFREFDRNSGPWVREKTVMRAERLAAFTAGARGGLE